MPWTAFIRLPFPASFPYNRFMNYALLAFLVTTLSTAGGALPALVVHKTGPKFKNAMMGFSAGVMLAATCFSLLLPALALVEPLGGKKASLLVALCVLLGGVFLKVLNATVPHEHFFKGREGKVSPREIKKIWLFVFAITLHNFPEGLAVGSGAGSESGSLAFPIMAGIALQDIPEGFVVAIALVGIGYSPLTAIGASLITGLVEGLAALTGYFATSTMQEALPWCLAFSGGAMLYVISEEIIPESHRKANSEYATIGLMIGFVLMMFLDTALG